MAEGVLGSGSGQADPTTEDATETVKASLLLSKAREASFGRGQQ